VIVFLPRQSKIANLVPSAIEARPLPHCTYGELYLDTSRHIFNEKHSHPRGARRAKEQSSRVLSQEEARFQLFIGMFGGG
jgi:hypothetical protein